MATRTNRSPGTVTLADVAERVGVSARTVSRVVNGEGGCTEATRQRILDAIAELGYRPNLMARGLTRRRSDMVGLVAAEMRDPFFPEFADGVERAASASGRTMFLASTAGERSLQHQALATLIGHGADGAIVFPATGSADDLAGFAREGLRIVVVNSDIAGPGIGSVSAEIQHGAAQAVAHLVERGRRRIAFLAPAGGRTGRRERGYRAALERAGLPIDESLIIEVSNSLDGGRQGAVSAMSLDHPPDAIFAYNDLIAIGVLQQCLALGHVVPDEIAIVGFDDISMCEAMTPGLTSVRIDRDQLGRAAVEMVQQLVDNGEAAPRTYPVELIARASSG